MRVNQNLWMLDGEWADHVEDLVGTASLIRLVAMRMRFQRGNRSHSALQLWAKKVSFELREIPAFGRVPP